MTILGVTLILAVANIIDLTLRFHYKRDPKDPKDKPDDENNDD